jgi:hypothetical protein
MGLTIPYNPQSDRGLEDDRESEMGEMSTLRRAATAASAIARANILTERGGFIEFSIHR